MQKREQTSNHVFSGSTLTRRSFTSLLGGGIAAAAFGQSAGTAIAQEVPKRGGLLRVAMHSQSTNDTFNSAKFTFSNDYIRGTSFYNTLTTTNQSAEAVPSLAEFWETPNGGKSWVFKIVKGVTFHDGSPLTTQDIIFSILRHKDEKLASSARPLAMNIENVRADGPNAIIVDLVQPDADFPIMIGTFQFAIVKDGTTDFSMPNGTGPFKIKEFKPGILTSGVRNENYWRDGRPYLDGFEMFYIVDPVARVNALLAGDAHMISDVKGATLDEVDKSGVAHLFRTAAPRYTALQSSVDMAPMSNHDLRLALSYLVDRKRFLETVLKGNGSLANDHPIMSDSSLYNATLPQRNLDPERAKFHLKKSGIGSSPVELHVSEAAPFSVELAQLVQREAARIGFNLNVRREPPDSYWNTIPGHRPYYANALNPRPTYNMLLNLTWKSGVPWNYSHYNDSKLDGLIDKARMSLDQTERKEIYGEIQKIIYDAACYTVPCFMNFVDGVSNKVKGLTPVPVGNLGGFNFADTVWLES